VQVARLILLAGIPAAGKSHFARWLESEHGAKHFDIDIEADRNAVIALNTGSPEDMVANLKNGHALVILNWGFNPASELPTIRALQKAGAELWWFDADHHAAREAYQIREDKKQVAGLEPIPIARFDEQHQRITIARSEIERVFAGRIIRTLEPSGKRRACEHVWKEMRKGRK
jgi:hypothetical protein